MKVVIPDPIELPEKAKQRLRSSGALLYDDMPKDVAELVNRIKDAEIIKANYVDVTSEIIDGVPSLKYIIVPAVGYEWIDIAYAASKGIKVLNCPTFNSEAVAEHALTLLLAANRKLIAATESLEAGKWEHEPLIGMELFGKKLGLIGYGNIGRRIEQLVSGFDMQVSYVNSKSSHDGIDRLLRESDVVCLCAPLNENTKHLVDKRRLGLLKKTAILVNVGRGAVIEQPALLEVLLAGRLAAAGLDVFEGEPLTGRPNDEIIALARLPNVVATPHIAYNTYETAAKLGKEIYDDIQSCLTGKPVNVVNY